MAKGFTYEYWYGHSQPVCKMSSAFSLDFPIHINAICMELSKVDKKAVNTDIDRVGC